MAAQTALAGLGLVILLLAGDSLVRGAVNLSLRIGVSPLIVSLSVVAFGTSAPELLISVEAILDDAPGLALGNVVGSNIANVLLVLGVPAIISGLAMTETDSGRSYLTMLGGSALFAALCFAAPLTWWHGLILLAALGLTLWDAARDARRKNGAPDPEDLDGAEPGMPGWRIALFVVLGLVGLPLGANLLVDNAIQIAAALGVSDTVIGLSLVAIGTSLPELATTVMAAMRKQAEVAVGNVIGSNFFNLLGIIGVAVMFGAIPVEASVLRMDLWVMLACSLLLAPFVLLRRDIGRLVGLGFCGLYAAYLVTIF